MRRRKERSAFEIYVEEEKLKVSVSLQYVGGLSEKIRRLLKQLSIGGVFKPLPWKWKGIKGVKGERKRHFTQWTSGNVSCSQARMGRL